MVILAAVLASLVLQTPQAAQAPPGTAVVRGKVVDKATGAPIPRAVVALQSARMRDVVQNITDDRGAFEFLRVAAGTYYLQATAGEFRRTHLPAAYSVDGREGPAQLVLKDGEERRDIVLALAPALAVSGRIVDEEGHPLSNIRVVLRKPGGEESMRVYAMAPETDDRGHFRIHSVAPGRYRVCAEARAGMSFGAPGQTQAKRPRRFATTCHPAEPQGGELVVTDADVEGVEIQLRREDTYVIRGAALAADGTPPVNGFVQVNRLERNGSTGTSTQLSADGTFTVTNVVPGTYEIAVRTGRSERSFPPDDREPERASQRIEVTTSDVEGLFLQMRRGVALKGRLVFDDPVDVPLPDSLRVEARPVQSTGSMPTNSAKVEADGNFSLTGLFGPVVLWTPGLLPKGHQVKSILYRGRDISGIPTEFSGEKGHDVEIVLTSRTSELTGRVVDETGQPAERATVLHFPVEKERWVSMGGPFGRTSTQVTAQGYRLPQLVAGDYFVVALKPSDFSRLQLPEDYERLAAVAERITILERERRTADLRLATLPEKR